MNQNSMGRIGHMVEEVVIIGGGAAGINVLELLLRGCKDPGRMEITLLKKEDEGFFSMCGLPFALQGMYSTSSLNLFPPDFYGDKGIDLGLRLKSLASILKKIMCSLALASGYLMIFW